MVLSFRCPGLELALDVVAVAGKGRKKIVVVPFVLVGVPLQRFLGVGELLEGPPTLGDLQPPSCEAVPVGYSVLGGLG